MSAGEPINLKNHAIESVLQLHSYMAGNILLHL